MGAIGSRLSPEYILVPAQVQGKEEVLKLLVQALAAGGITSDPELLLKDLEARERLSSTALGSGCAVPHAHSAAMASTVFAAARVSPPLSYDTPDGDPVSLFFLMAGPKADTGLHLKLLSKLARLLHDPQMREDLNKADTPEAFHRIILEKDT